jgi:hypothetical protein
LHTVVFPDAVPPATPEEKNIKFFPKINKYKNSQLLLLILIKKIVTNEERLLGGWWTFGGIRLKRKLVLNVKIQW